MKVEHYLYAHWQFYLHQHLCSSVYHRCRFLYFSVILLLGCIYFYSSPSVCDGWSSISYKNKLTNYFLGSFFIPFIPNPFCGMLFFSCPFFSFSQFICLSVSVFINASLLFHAVLQCALIRVADEKTQMHPYAQWHRHRDTLKMSQWKWKIGVKRVC